jgi:L-arabinose isomerase
VNWNDLNRNQLAPHLEQSLKELEMKMEKLESLEIWFITGSQHLYGVEALKQVAANSQKIADSLGNEQLIPVKVVYKPVVTTPDEIRNLCREANNTEKCIGLVLWMHTFSPAKMWIAGLSSLAKPFLHLHTQFNRGLPWSSIDMDFMNLNQAAHGDREFGFITTRTEGRRRLLARPRDDRRDCNVDPRRRGVARLAKPQDRALRR